MRPILALAALALALVAPAAHADDLVENPDYKAWSSFKVGSWVKIETEVDGRLATEETLKLLELTAEQAVVDVERYALDGAKKMRTAEARRTIRAKMPKPDDKLPKRKEAKEELEVDGKKVACQVVLECSNEVADTKTRVKVWYSTEVPGGMLRTELRSEGRQTSTFLQRAVKWEAAK